MSLRHGVRDDVSLTCKAMCCLSSTVQPGVQARNRQGNASSAAAAAISSDAVLHALCDAAHGIIAGVSSSSSSVAMSAAAPAAGPLARTAAAGGAPGLSGHVSHSSSSSSSTRSSSCTPGHVIQHGTVSSNLHGSSPVRQLSSTVSSNYPGSSSSGGGNQPWVLKARAAGLGAPSARVQHLLGVLNHFMTEHVYTIEHVFEEHASGPHRLVLSVALLSVLSTA